MVIVVIILALLLTVVSVKLREQSKQQQQVIEINKERQEINRQLEQDIQNKQNQLKSISSSVDAQSNILKSLEATEQEMRAGAQKRADKEYEAYCQRLSADYQEKERQIKAEYNKQASSITAEIEKQRQTLQELKDKQTAYIKAQQRQKEIEDNSDYYRLCLNELDKNDIEMLRELQKKFSRKESVDKLIWESYYKPAYDALVSRLFKTTNKVSGIYKITDLTTNQSYIGQSVDIKERFRQHIKASLTYGQATNKLYQVMQKAGQYNLTFEILEEVPKDKLNEREIYWIDFYKTKDYGLNSTRGGS